MPLFKAVHHIGRTFMHYGPLGLFYAARQSWLAHRTRRLQICIDREKELHRAMVRNLNVEMNMLIGQQQALRVAAAHFFRYCEKQDAERDKPVAGV